MRAYLLILPLVFALGAHPLGAATFQFTSGSSTDIEAIRGVMINGELRDIEFFSATFTATYGTAPPYNITEATAISSLVRGILNGTDPQSPLFPQDLSIESTPILSVLGQTGFHAPDSYRALNPGTGRPDIGTRAGLLGTNGFSQTVWNNSLTSQEVNVPLVFVVAVAPVPEPSPLLLGALALAGLTLRRKRQMLV